MIPHKNVNSSCNEVSGEPVAGFLATGSLQGLTMVRSWPGEGLLGMVRLAWLALPAYWSGLPFPLPEDLPDPWIEPGSPTLQADSLLF